MTNLCLDLFTAVDGALLLVVVDSLTTVTGLEGRLDEADVIIRGFFFFFIPMTMPPDFFIVSVGRSNATMSLGDEPLYVQVANADGYWLFRFPKDYRVTFNGDLLAVSTVMIGEFSRFQFQHSFSRFFV